MKRSLSFAMFFFIASCDSSIEIKKDSSGVGGSSSSSTASSSSVSSSSGNGNGGSDPGLPCDPCENIEGTRIVRNRQVKTTIDGLHVVSDAGYWDKLLNEACYPQPTEGQIARCLPTGYGLTNHYSDPACTNLIVYFPSVKCYPNIPKYAIKSVTTSGMCPSYFYEVYSVGAPYGSSDVYTDVGGTCTQTTKLTGYDYYIVGSKIPSTEFVEIKTETVH